MLIKATAPTAELEKPVVFALKACAPIPTLLEPLVLEMKVSKPNMVLNPAPGCINPERILFTLKLSATLSVVPIKLLTVLVPALPWVNHMAAVPLLMAMELLAGPEEIVPPLITSVGVTNADEVPEVSEPVLWL